MGRIKVCIDEELCAAGLERWLSLDCIFKEGQRVLIIGPSGSGKTVFATSLLGKLAIYMSNPTIFIIDPKGSARRSSLKRIGTSQLNHCLL